MVSLTEQRDCTVVTRGPEETEDLGRRVGGYLRPGDVVALEGELGSGKTCFTRGLARGLGIDPTVPVVSPSFTLINEYPGPTPLYHFDLYRLNLGAELYDLGYQEYFFGKGVTVIEWAEKAEEMLPLDHLAVRFAYEDDEVRQIRLTGNGERFAALVGILETTLETSPKESR